MSNTLSILEDIKNELHDCTRCSLHEKRKNIVFGEGNPAAEIVFVGEGPGENEDNTGRPFVGRAGQLLDKMIIAMGLKRSDVFISNIVKCRPPNNRVPQQDEATACKQFVIKEITAIQPKIVVTLGMSATKHLISIAEKTTMGNIHGKFFNGSWTEIPSVIQVVPTYHPAALLRNEQLKQPTWQDLQKVINFLKTGEVNAF